MSELSDAVQRGDYEAVKEILIKSEDGLCNTTEVDGYTLAHWAAYNDDQKILELLSDYEADMTARTKSKGLNILHLAVMQTSRRCLSYILSLEELFPLILDSENLW